MYKLLSKDGTHRRLHWAMEDRVRLGLDFLAIDDMKWEWSIFVWPPLSLNPLKVIYNMTIVSSQMLVLAKSFHHLLQKLELDSMNNPKMFDGGKIFCRGGGGSV